MAGVLSSNFSISKPSGRCAATGRDIAPGEAFTATLCESPDSPDFQRQDFTAAAWSAGERPTPPLTLFASWRAVQPHPDQKRRMLVSDDELLDLFDQLASATQPRQQAFRYVLALLLIRRRLLHYESATPGSLRVRVRTPADQPQMPVVEVPDAHLDPQSLQAVLDQLSEVVGA